MSVISLLLLLPLDLTPQARADGGAFDHAHAAFARVLDGAATGAGVDYRLLGARRAALDAYVREIASADTAGWSDAQKLALYVNAYNALTLATVLDSGPPASIRDIDGGKVWDVRTFTVAGERLTLNQIENNKVRPLADGRIHAALNCASKGCPPLGAAPLTATGQSAQLDALAQGWVRTNAYALQGDRIAVSMIFDWYADDFADERKGDIPGVDGKAENALWFIARFADGPVRDKLVSGALTVDWQPYDWSLNRR
jgi:hypothetical protein